MAHGGSRKNAGRRRGALTKRTQEIVAKASADGIMPLEYMLNVMRTSTDIRRKDAMAIAAAPFVHPKLAAVEHSGDEDRPVTFNIITGVSQPELEHNKPKVNGVNGHVNGRGEH
jgi:hypothetical protein